MFIYVAVLHSQLLEKHEYCSQNLEPPYDTSHDMLLYACLYELLFEAEKKEWIPETSFGEGSISEFSQLGHFGLLFVSQNLIKKDSSEVIIVISFRISRMKNLSHH